MIVLSITILVMAILAAAAIISLEDSGIIGRSKSTVSKQNYLQEYERLQSVKNGMLANNFGEITVADYIEELRNKGILESGEQTNPDDSTTVVTKTGMVANLIQDGESNIIISLGTSNATITLSSTSVSGDVTSGPVTREVSVIAKNVIGDISWTTSNATVATVTGNNTKATVTLKNPGTADITATYGSAKESFRVTVTGTVATPVITFNKTTISKTIDAGTTATETLIATTSNVTGSLVWTSSNTNVATVSASGNTATITMKSGGTTIITAKSGNATATCTVVVTENIPTLYELSGTWVFNESPDVWSLETKENISFTSNSIQFTSIEVLGGEIYYYDTSDSATVGYTESWGWPADSIVTGVNYDSKYRTVDFGTTPQAVSEEFYNWFTANATQGTINNVSCRIVFTEGTYLMTADENSTWGEIIGEGLTIYDSVGGEWLLEISSGYVKATFLGLSPAPADPSTGHKIAAADKIGICTNCWYNSDGYLYCQPVTDPT